MRRPAAATHLARIIHATSTGSIARAIAENRLEIRSTGPTDDLILAPLRALAKEEKLIEDEARALAQTRGWPTNLAGAPYGWTRLKGETAQEALPRLIRIYDREIFELDDFLRARDEDDEVGSLLATTLDGRRSIRAELAALDAAATLPGAK